MHYNIISNVSSEDNHLTRLKTLFSLSDTVVITSPYLMIDFTDFFSEVDLTQLKKIHLITTLPPNSFDQITKVSSLISFIEFPDIRDNRIASQISLDNKLHGKIYIFKKNEEYIAAIVSSANFTGSGLSRKHEWGIEIFNKDEIKKLETSILDCVQFHNLTFEDIYRMQQVATDFLTKQPKVEEREINLKLTDLLASVSWTNQLADTVQFWLKPIGATNSPVNEDLPFDKIDDKLNFSKLRPTGVKPGDILLAYGVGTTKILSIYRVTSFPIKETTVESDNHLAQQRWPWYVQVHNLTPNFGSAWAKHDLWINMLKEDFLRNNPGETITAVGGRSLGALKYGKDKLKLSPAFAKSILDKVTAINDHR